jgi:hypothetical protein
MRFHLAARGRVVYVGHIEIDFPPPRSPRAWGLCF